ncbi:MAG: rhodanese-like domain-containing protein [Burkholderia sp.]|nr:rhodanese-like domain-containing protein [Burkholderia sp.]
MDGNGKEHSMHAELITAQEKARAEGLLYSGSISPKNAWALTSVCKAVLIDVRTAEERMFVGKIPGSVHIPWIIRTTLDCNNHRFITELEEKIYSKDTVLLMICRSGNRSVVAANAAAKAGFGNVYNVLEGFEGDLDAFGHRNSINGWRFHGLPWTQS